MVLFLGSRENCALKVMYSVGFGLLNGITTEQAQKILNVLNENVIGVLVTTASDDKTEAASG